MTRELSRKGADSGDALTLLLVALVVIGGEASIRMTESWLSGNIAHIREMPRLVERAALNPASSLVVVGNSLANNGIDVEVLSQSHRDRRLHSENIIKLIPDGTNIWSWQCLLNSLFPAESRGPNTVVIPYAWNQLSDQSRLMPDQLGALFCSIRDFTQIRKYKDLTISSTGEFLAAKVLRVFSHRETIRNRTLSKVIPRYESVTQLLNQQSSDIIGDLPIHHTYSALEQLINMLRQRQSRLVVVAMPLRDYHYEIDGALTRTLKLHNVQLLDYRLIDGLSEDMFLDSMHLGEVGATIVSARLANDIQTYFSKNR